jgi:hypothetical protein
LTVCPFLLAKGEPMRNEMKLKIDVTEAMIAVDELTAKIKALRAEVEALATAMDTGLTYDEYYNRARAGALNLEYRS